MPHRISMTSLRKQTLRFLVMYAKNMFKVRHSHNHSKGGLIDAI